MNRLGSRLLALSGFVLAGLMVYTLAFEVHRPGPWRSWRASREAAEVVVYFPDRASWADFRRGAHACAARKLARVVEEGEEALLVETAKHGRRVRFTWHDVRGVRETRDDVRRLSGGPRPTVAVIGSTNSALTVALAEELRDSTIAAGVPGPILLVPRATAVLTERPEPDSEPIAFLDLYPGRIFRLCPNNQSQANLVARCLIDLDRGVTVARAEVVVDRHDPYSVDLADSFHRVLERRFKSAELVEHADALALPGLWSLPGLPSATEDALAASICRQAEHHRPGEATWVVLPLQEEPALRMLVALSRHASTPKPSGGGPLRVVCGDGIGMTILFRLANQCPFPVWCFSPDSLRSRERGSDSVVATDAQVLAETFSVVVRCLDLPQGRNPTADGLRTAMSELRLSADDPAAFGRSLAFTRSGERQGDDLGHVLTIRPGSAGVSALVRTPAGKWSATALEPPVSVATWP